MQQIDANNLKIYTLTKNKERYKLTKKLSYNRVIIVHFGFKIKKSKNAHTLPKLYYLRILNNTFP